LLADSPTRIVWPTSLIVHVSVQRASVHEMQWALAVIAVVVLGVAAVSRRLTGTPVTVAMVLVAVGVIVGPELLDEVDVSPLSGSVRTFAEATLTLVLFADAARIDLRALRREYGLPLRLLGIGLPLTIAAGTALAAVLFGTLSLTEALVLAIVLAPTDAALGQAVMTQPRVPLRIRQGLNVESGLNDGICVPLLLIALAGAEVSAHAAGRHAPAKEPMARDALVQAQQPLADPEAVRVGHRKAGVVGDHAEVGDVVVEAFQLQQDHPQIAGPIRYRHPRRGFERLAVGERVTHARVA